MKRHFLLSLILFAQIALFSWAVVAQPPVGDLLLYFDEEREPPGITAYNPATGEKLELPVSDERVSVATSGDGRIAYVQDNDIWVLDVLNAPNSPTNITQTPNESEWILGWTPDRRLLEYQVGESPGPYIRYTYDGSFLRYQAGSSPGPHILYIYDGNEVIAVDYGYNVWRYWNEQGWYVAAQEGNLDGTRWSVWNGHQYLTIMLPMLADKPAWQELQWTPDNHLFIIVGYSEQEYAQPIGSTDVFYWNGSDVHQVDNPSEDETFMLGDWSADGRLTLYTSQDYFDRWYIWDGVSFTPDGVPDTSTLTAINSPTEQIDDIEWMPDGRLAIVAVGDPESDSLLGHAFSCTAHCRPQVYLWDSQALQQVTSNDGGRLLIDVHPNGSIAVSDFDGLRIWGITVFDDTLRPVFQSRGPHSLSRWSADSNLAYCSGDDLHVWDGQDSTQLSARTSSKWLIASSPSMTCSAG